MRDATASAWLEQLRELLSRPTMTLSSREVAAGLDAIREATRQDGLSHGQPIDGARGTFDGPRRYGAEEPGVPREMSDSDVGGRAFHGQRSLGEQPARVGLRGMGLLGKHTLRVVGIAAAIVLAIAIPRLLTLLRGVSSPATSQLYGTARGQSGVVTLADGSTIVLAPETKIRYTVDRNGARIVDLIGEALFTVATQTHHPFVVRTGAVNTRVLGTTFDVRRYLDERATQVTVIAGRVSIGRTRQTVLNAGMLALATDSAVMTSVVSDANEITDWVNGRLVFQNAPVSEVLSAVRHWYGVDITLADSTLAYQRLTTELDVHRSRSDLIAILETVLDVRITATGDTLRFVPSRKTHHAPERNAPSDALTPNMEIGR